VNLPVVHIDGSTVNDDVDVVVDAGEVGGGGTSSVAAAMTFIIRRRGD